MSIFQALIIDNATFIRTALKILLNEKFEHIVVREACGLEEVSRNSMDWTQYDLIILGDNLADMAVKEAIYYLRRACPHARVLIFADRFVYQEAIDLLSHGADGYCIKTMSSVELEATVKALVRGELYLCSELIGAIVDEKVATFGKINCSPPGGYLATALSVADLKLSDREREIARQLAFGNSTSKIASILGLKPSTVSTHKAHIFQKLGVRNLVGLINLLGKVG